MSKKKSPDRPGYSRLLDAWVPPEGAGEAVGCLSTSFTFDAAFFEEECLGRFLQLECDPEDHGAIYLIEREEKLAKLSCAAMIVDAQHCRGSHNLRWDLMLSRVPSGCQHAKVSVLYWQNRIRVIVGSANMTPSGYRHNQEIFAIMDWFDNGPLGRSTLLDIVTFLKELLTTTTNDFYLKSDPPLLRATSFLDRLLATAEKMSLLDQTSAKSGVQVVPVFCVPEGEDVLAQIVQHWPESNLPYLAQVTSPFFDTTSSHNEPAFKLWDILRKRGETTVIYNVPLGSEADGRHRLFAPRSLVETCPTRGSASVEINGVPDEATDAKEQWAHRSLHAKSIRLDGNRYAAYMVGSSNFTSKGLGLVKNCNWEANLLYLIHTEKNPQAAKQLYQSQLPVVPIKNPEECHWQPVVDDGEPTEGDNPILPASFQSAIYRTNSHGQAEIIFRFGKSLPTEWKIYPEQGLESCLSEDRWRQEGSPNELTIAWDDIRPPGGFEVTWSDSSARAWLPVNVENSGHLPPPDELKNLPLDLLIEILVTAAPLHRVLQQFLKRKNEVAEKSNFEETINPHKNVETSNFLLQRTRRLSLALNALRVSLERPVLSLESLAWRLNGPVGVGTLAKAIESEAHTEAEQAFLLCELCLELSKVNPQEISSALAAEEVKQKINEVIADIQSKIETYPLQYLPKLKAYVDAAFRRAG